ncbi:MAG: GT4 family glycosyltransferase PelF [Opitutales bacterium]
MSGEKADVCLLLEGSYPYLKGGVSSWVHQLVTELSDVSFAIFYLGSRKETTGNMLYDLPRNIVAYREVFLYDKLHEREAERGHLTLKERKELYERLEALYLGRSKEDQVRIFFELIDLREALGERLTFANLCEDREVWLIMEKVYEAFCPNESFIDFFWTARFLHLPVWKLLDRAAMPPPARMYHSASTGFAGLAGAIASRRYEAPYLITEHGIYAKERIAEISTAKWIYQPKSSWFQPELGLGKIKLMWIKLFTFLGDISYAEADRVISLYDGNTHVQEEFGADRRKLHVIPNGIDISRYDAAFEKRRSRLQSPAEGRVCIGFIGRVVPIKDVKTLLRAAKIVVQKNAKVIFKLIGPLDEDPEYSMECREMVDILDLQEHIVFTGPQNIVDVIHELDVLVLTSFSEGQPLTIMEGFSAGIPVVSTDVGGCRELIFGRTPEDKEIGRAGFLTKICSPHDTAASLLGMMGSPEQFVTLGEAGRRRMERYYYQDRIMNLYRGLYTGRSWVSPSESAPSIT